VLGGRSARLWGSVGRGRGAGACQAAAGTQLCREVCGLWVGERGGGLLESAGAVHSPCACVVG
jgi:hypothetical protein